MILISDPESNSKLVLVFRSGETIRAVGVLGVSFIFIETIRRGLLPNLNLIPARFWLFSCGLPFLLLFDSLSILYVPVHNCTKVVASIFLLLLVLSSDSQRCSFGIRPLLSKELADFPTAPRCKVRLSQRPLWPEVGNSLVPNAQAFCNSCRLWNFVPGRLDDFATVVQITGLGGNY